MIGNRLLAACLTVFWLFGAICAAVAQPASLGRDNSDSIAVIVGNRTYRQTVPVDFAHNDADAMKEFIIGQLGFREQNVFILKDATLNEFNQVFGTERNPQSGRLWRAAREGRSNVFVYFSGHGVPDLQSRQPFLLPADGDPNQSESGYPLDTLYRNLDLVRQKVGQSRHVVVMIDACFTGETGRKGETLLAVSAPGFTPARPRSGQGVIKMLATSANSPANWDQESQLGLFTSQFLKGVAGLASPGQPEVAFASLSRFLAENVAAQARRDSGREQRPEIDDAPLVLPAGRPVAAIAASFGRTTDEQNWRQAEQENTPAAFERYIARCGSGACAFRSRAMAMLTSRQDAGATAADEANWKRFSGERRYQDYLDGCRSVCAYREVALGYLGASDPGRDGRVQRCDRLAGAGFDPDRPREVTRVCLGQIDAKAAIAACQEAAQAQPSVRRLYYQLGRAQDAAGNYREARAAYAKAVEMGSAAALNNLATLHENGEGVPKSITEAERLYRRGAEAGSVTAMSNLARFLEYGLAGRKDLREAARWYKACSDREDAFCRTKHANMILSRAPGAEGDALNAILMVRKSAEQGEVMALVTLATIIDQGFGSGAGATGTALDFLRRALKRGDRAVVAMTTPDIFGKLKPETRVGLQRIARGAGYDGPQDGRLSPALVAALKRAAAAAERSVTPQDFADAGEGCG
ncbi:MAG: caspase family protein [Beijerinckiaceae bacterium]